MTSSEAISKLQGKKELLDSNGFANLDEFDIAISALEENTKLKAEIEKLKGELKSEREFRANVRIELLDRKTEIEQLRYDLKNEREWITKFKNDYEKLKSDSTAILKSNILLKNELAETKKQLVEHNINYDLYCDLQAENEKLKSELKQSVKFKEYFMELYNQGLEVANWHLNGVLEPLTNFIDSACEEVELELKGGAE